jgi:hypothetical protein
MINCKLTTSEDDVKIKSVLTMLEETGLIKKYLGACTSASKVLYSLLLQNGIRSKVVICNALLRVHVPDKPQQLLLIGFAETGKLDKNLEDLHAVVITETNPRWLIDTSIGLHLPTEHKIICEVADEHDVHLGNYSNPLYSITYTKRKLTMHD